MGAQLNIKSEDAYRLAWQLAELTGESLTTVVTCALRSELERARHKRDLNTIVGRMLEAGREIRAHMTEGASSNHDWLYDENGLPR